MSTTLNRVTADSGLAVAFFILSMFMATSTVMAADPILNIEDSPITTSQDLSMEDVERIIIEGCRVRNWEPDVVAPGHIVATLYIRSHVAKVDIMFNTKNYSITYKDSVNLDYKKGKIHRNYNKWVRNLNSDIQAQIPG